MLCYYPTPAATVTPKNLEADFCIYGLHSGGVIAAISAKQNGHSVVLIGPERHLGGLTAGGLSMTDIGNKRAIGGLSREFYKRAGRHYGQDEQWLFEPHVAERIFEEWLAELGIETHRGAFLKDVTLQDGRIQELTTENEIRVRAKIFVDASYEGDLMARAGVPFTVGREDNRTYGETVNGSQIMPKHQFEFPVDPYIVEGDPSSGLLPGIDPESHTAGQGDHRVQAYNFRLCLTKKESNRIPFTEPPGYDRSHYELLARYCRAGYEPEFTKFDNIAGEKVDMNNHGAVSTDFIGANHAWPTASYEERERIFQAHVAWVSGLLWFWTSDHSIPSGFQTAIREWGWCRDEFPETGGFSHALYVREARRLVGDLVMTEHHCRGEEVVPDSISLAAYTMDSHNCRRVVVDGKVRNEGDVQVWSGPPYSVSYRSIIPPRGSCKNLFVPFCLSASHIAFGSIRMEPVFMILSQSAAEAGVLALEQGIDVQDVPYELLRERLLARGQILDPVEKSKSAQSGE